MARLVLTDLELHLVFLGIADIGRVGDHQIETAGVESLKQVGLMKMNTLIETVTGRVCTGDLKSSGRNVGRVNLGLRARDEYGGRNDKIHAPEFLMSGDVLSWNSRGALRNCFLVIDFLLRSQ